MTVTVNPHIKNIGIFLLFFLPLTGSEATVTVQYRSHKQMYRNGLHLVKVLYSVSLGRYSFLHVSEEAAAVGS